ncbi:hypothetical protein HYH03_018747, partial [Edaphochlamys debaryana]
TIVQHPVHKFNWTNEGRGKWGFVAMERNATIKLKLDTRVPGQPPPDPKKPQSSYILLGVAYLQSYEGMGQARVRCESGCSCSAMDFDSHSASRNVSLTNIANVAVSQHEACVVSITTLGPSKAAADAAAAAAAASAAATSAAAAKAAAAATAAASAAAANASTNATANATTNATASATTNATTNAAANTTASVTANVTANATTSASATVPSGVPVPQWSKVKLMGIVVGEEAGAQYGTVNWLRGQSHISAHELEQMAGRRRVRRQLRR